MIALDETTLRLLEIGGAWLSAVGSLAAAIVALYLGLRQTAARLDVTAGHRLILERGSDHKWPEVLSIRVVNLATKPVIIENVGWRWGLFKKHYAIQTLNASPLSHNVPVELKPGGVATFIVPLKETDWLVSMSKDLVNPRFPRLSAWTLKVQVYTSVGKTFTQRAERGLRQQLILQAQSTV